MYAKLKISGIINVVTGLHIGGSSAFSAIGAVDSPVIKDPLTGLPLLPGSSFKGKMRTLLAREINQSFAKDPNHDDPRILSLFGSSDKPVRVARLLFSDALMSNWPDLEKRGLSSMTEVKFENTINRATAVANPRQIERVVRGSLFPLELIYEINDTIVGDNGDINTAVLADMELISEGLKLIQYDYLGGSGSRGYGKVKFCNIKVENAIGKTEQSLIDKCNDCFKFFETNKL